MTWNPRPSARYSEIQQSDYLAGYSDGYHLVKLGAGHDGSRNQDAYRQGFNEGTDDRINSDVSKGILKMKGPNIQNIPVRTPEGKAIRDSFLEGVKVHPDYAAAVEARSLEHTSVKQYVHIPSENFATRENQVSDYSPDLCYKFGLTHKAYGWSPIPRGDWDDAQKAAYLRAFEENPVDKT